MLFGLFRRKKAPSANLAKERLKIIVEHSRSDAKRPEFLNQMRREILEVVNKYVEVDIADINTNIANQGDSEVLELNIILPDTVHIEAQEKKQADSDAGDDEEKSQQASDTEAAKDKAPKSTATDSGSNKQDKHKAAGNKVSHHKVPNGEVSDTKVSGIKEEQLQDMQRDSD
ncbi:MAG: cell division topological specificity factor MinE [Gammaproteobacteria bacterium]|nr:MAG: cell division topological specificity factor MinE [Gammaproteobacteria bacterium]